MNARSAFPAPPAPVGVPGSDSADPATLREERDAARAEAGALRIQVRVLAATLMQRAATAAAPSPRPPWWRRLVARAPGPSAVPAPRSDVAAAVTLDMARRARLLTDAAKAMRSEDLAKAAELGELAVQLDPKPYRMKWLASLLYDAGMIDRPAALFVRAQELGEPLSGALAARAEVIRGLAAIRRDGIAVPPRSARPAYEPEARSVVMVTASSLPHHVTGYTTRTHNLIRAIGDAGWNVAATTRPGYPWDRSDAREVAGDARHYQVDRIAYARLPGPAANSVGFDRYHGEAQDAVLSRLGACRAAIVHAASNYANGLPALAAARRAGVPFVYEVRGLWELTAATKHGLGVANQRFDLMRDMERLVAAEADAVLVIAGTLKDELVERGIDPAKIAIVPNCVDTKNFHPRPRSAEATAKYGLGGRFVIGFIGSIVAYEGLDDLVEATASLVARGLDPLLLIVGEGDAAAAVRQRARDLGIADRLVMPGRVPPDAVPDIYSAIDLAVFPRKPSRVTEIVSPLKPLEAMAMGKPVIASSVAALADMVDDGRTGLLFEKGSVPALAAAIERLARDPALAAGLAESGRRHVAAHRSWRAAAAVVSEVYEDLLRRAATREVQP